MRIFMSLIILLIILMSFSYSTNGQTSETKQKPVPSASHFILLDEMTGRVLQENNAHERVSIASITKLMTAVVALEYGDLEERIKVSEQAIKTNGSSIYLEVGEELSLEDLLYGLMLRSGNDAAKVIAEGVGGSEEGFVYLMNEMAAYLGMTNSSFKNPHGLDEKDHYSSAYDIAILMQYAMQQETFKKISATTSYHSEQRTYPWKNKNKLLTEKYEYTTGGKTGFTNQAGRTLVTTAEKDQMKLITVTLDASDDWNDHIALYEWGFTSFDLVQLEEEGEHHFATNEFVITGQVPYDVIYPLLQEEQKDLRKKVEVYQRPKGDRIGLMTYYIDANNPLLEVPVFQRVEHKKTMKEKWIDFFKDKTDD